MTKKTAAIILGIFFVMTFAGIASADFDITGKYEFRGQYKFTDSSWDVKAENLELNIKGSGFYGPASSDLTFKLNGVGDPGKVVIDTANFNYKLNDALTLGVTYKLGTFMLLDDIKANVKLYGGDWMLGSDTYLKGVLTLAAGNLTIYTTGDLNPLELALTGTYTFGPVGMSCWLNYNDTKTKGRLLGRADWTVTEGLTLTGEYLYDYDLSRLVEIQLIQDAATRVEYRKGGFDTYLRVGYSTNGDNVYYKVYGEIPVITNTLAYGWYEDRFFTGGVKYVFGQDTYLLAEYVQKDQSLYIKLGGAF